MPKWQTKQDHFYKHMEYTLQILHNVYRMQYHEWPLEKLAKWQDSIVSSSFDFKEGNYFTRFRQLYSFPKNIK